MNTPDQQPGIHGLEPTIVIVDEIPLVPPTAAELAWAKLPMWMKPNPAHTKRMMQSYSPEYLAALKAIMAGKGDEYFAALKGKP